MIWPFTVQWRLKRNQKKASDASEREKAKLQQLKQTRPPDDPAIQAQQQVCIDASAKYLAAQAAYDKWLKEQIHKGFDNLKKR